MDILHDVGGLRAIAQELGISESQAAAGVNALSPAILGGMKRHTQSHSSGLDGLLATIEQPGGASLPDGVLGPPANEPGTWQRVVGTDLRLTRRQSNGGATGCSQLGA
jgi:hypothetical protein